MNATAITPCAPLVHDADFQRLPAAERTRVRGLVALMEALDKAANLSAACAHYALQTGGERGMSAASLERKLRGWRAAGRDWRALVDRAKVPAMREDKRLRNDDFLNFFRALCENNKRKSAAAVRELTRRWHAGERIPGYGSWREVWALENPGVPAPANCPGVPEGWSPRNLYRMLPSERALKLARQGFSAAAQAGPHIRRSTKDLRPLELVVADDFRLDVMAVLRSPRMLDGRLYKAGVYAVAGLLLMDVATRRVCGWVLKLQMRDEAGKRLVIRREDLALLVGVLIAENGLPEAYPVELYTENATAALTTEAKAALAAHFGGRIRINQTGLFNNALVEGGFRETGGKPWHKGWVESFFSRMHTELAALPGQIGAKYDLTPGDHEAKLRTTEKLLADAAKVSDRAAEALRLPFLGFDELTARFAEALEALNRRTDHKLGDFEDVAEFRLDEHSDWMPEAALALVPAEVALQLECRSRKESPLERWERLRRAQKFAPVPAEAVAPLLSTPRTVRPHRGMIEFQEHGVRHTFFSPKVDERLFADGAQWVAHWSPAAPELVYLYRTDGAFVGAVPEFRAVHALDKESIGAAAAQTMEAANRTLSQWRMRHPDESGEAKADREHNALVLAGGGRIGLAPAAPKVPESPRLSESAPEPKPKRKAPRIADLGESSPAAPQAEARPKRSISDLL